jgi:YebC/PmpR family DNA-binding regulatory protein
MAGHSKFKNIQFRKGAQDKKRSKLFSKLSRDITLAAKTGLADPGMKAQGGETDSYEEIRYEGFGPGGVGLIIEVLTDNRNRAAANVRAIFGKNGGNLGESGSVSFMFDRLGQIVYPISAGSEDKVMEAAIEAGAEDVETDPGDEDTAATHVVYTAFEDLGSVVEGLEATLGPAKSTAVIWKPKTLTPVAGDDVATLMKLIDALDDDDDVQTVFGNYDIPDEELAKLG